MLADRCKPQVEALVLAELGTTDSLARWVTGNPSDAQDVVPDAMVRMLKYINTFRGAIRGPGCSALCAIPP